MVHSFAVGRLMWPVLHWMALHTSTQDERSCWIFDVFSLVILPHFFPCISCRNNSRCHIRKTLQKLGILLPSQSPERFVFALHNRVNRMLKKAELAWDLYERDKRLGTYDTLSTIAILQLWIAILMEWDHVEPHSAKLKPWAWTAMQHVFPWTPHEGSCGFALPAHTAETCDQPHHAPSLHLLQAKPFPIPLQSPSVSTEVAICSLLGKLAEERHSTMEEEWKRLQQALQVQNPEECPVSQGCT